MNTLKGAYRDINIKVDEINLNYDYTHENPFPSNGNEPQQIDEDFKMVFDKVCGFFNG